MISARASALLAADPGILFEGFNRALRDPYDATTHPGGTINLGTAENQLNTAEIVARLRDAAAASVTSAATKYQNHTGTARLRAAVAALLARAVRPLAPVLPAHVAILNGAGTTLDTLFQVLCDPGDGVLLPAPYYGAFDQDLGKRAQARIVPVPTTSAQGFQLRLEDVVRVHREAVAQGVRVRALLLSSPNNPFGTIYPAELLQALISYTAEHDLHLVSDEIYMLSDYSRELSQRPGFVSVLSLPQPKPDNVHVIWAFSKDFCVSGFRTGVLVSRNSKVLEAFDSLSYFTGVPVPTQNLLTLMLDDEEWTDGFLRLNRQRLAAAYRFIVARLEPLGIRVLPANAGFFVWVDLRPFLSAQTFDAELALWNRLLEHKLYIGLAFRSPEPGWFRIITAAPTQTIELAVERVRRAIAAGPRL